MAFSKPPLVTRLPPSPPSTVHVVEEIAVCEVAVQRVVGRQREYGVAAVRREFSFVSFHPLRVYWLKTLLTNVIVQVMGKCSVSEQSLPARLQRLWEPLTVPLPKVAEQSLNVPSPLLREGPAGGVPTVAEHPLEHVVEQVGAATP